ncbi:MAG: chemotaxis protein CheW [Granulosicoccus sp.]
MSIESAQTEIIHGSENQYLSFLLNGEEYGIEILNVQEIKSWVPCTPLPRSPEYVLGVINLRGAIVPIVDLRAKMNLPAAEMTSTTAVIIVSVEFEQNARTVGLVVDCVSDVYQLMPENIQAADEGQPVSDRPSCITAYGHIENKLLILINLEPIITSTLEATKETD